MATKKTSDVKKKSTLKDKTITKKTLKINKNILSIIFGAISSIGALLIPSIFSLFGIAGLILAYNSKKEKSTKLNRWGFYISILGILLSLVFMTLALFYMASYIQTLQGMIPAQ